MRTLRTGLLLIALIAVFTSCDKSASQKFMMNAKFDALVNPIALNAGDCGETFTTKLMAGQHMEAGLVKVWVQDGTLMVKYIANPDWLISETHLEVANNADLIPHTNTGNPKIGNFRYKGYHDPMLPSVLYEIPLEGLAGTVYIAAHAVVFKQDCKTYKEIGAMLPTNPVGLVFNETLTESYYELTVSDAGQFTGTHLAWCADNNHEHVGYTPATLISSYNPDMSLLGEVVPKPENLDLLNYLMNKYYPETPFRLLQAAIWNLMNGSYSFSGGGLTPPAFTPEEKAKVNIILNEVKTNGNNFVPGPGEYLVILVNSGDSDNWQNVFFLYKECMPSFSETAWGQGNPFTPEKGSWAMYFGYCIK